MDQSSSSSSKKMSETSSSSSSKFFTKMFSCFHVKASTTEATASSSSSSSSVPSSVHHHHERQQQQQEEKQLVIYVGGVGVDKESMLRYSVPWTYVSSYPQFKKLLLEKSSSSLSGEELQKIRSEGGSLVIHCEVSEFEYARKRVESQEKQKNCLFQSYDDRLWSGYWKRKEMEKEKSTPEIINNNTSSSSSNSNGN